MKIEIVESPFKPATRKSVCSHLEPISNLLEAHGGKFDWATGLIPDKTRGNILLSESEIDFNLIRDRVNIPEYIKLHEERELIFCKKCWCAIERKMVTKTYNSSIQP